MTEMVVSPDLHVMQVEVDVYSQLKKVNKFIQYRDVSILLFFLFDFQFFMI